VRLLIYSLKEFVVDVENDLRSGFNSPEFKSHKLHITKAVSPDGEIMGYIGLNIIPKDDGTRIRNVEVGWPGISLITQEGENESGHEDFPSRKGPIREAFLERQRVLAKAWFRGRTVCTVNAVYTLPEFQRRGVGTALMKWANDLVRRSILCCKPGTD
jgi:GNAT superfamily N-acetyltransferase